MTSILLVLYILLNLGLFFSDLKPLRLKYNPPIENLKCDNCPDIFFLILDSYTSNHSLRSYFSFDNTDFSSQLENLGFKVSDQSLSSYSKTAYSMASTFNLGRIDSLDQYFESDMVELIKKSTVAKSLTEKGYLIYNYSLFDILEESKYYSVSLELIPGFVNVIYQNTILKWFVDNVNQYTDMYSIHNEILDRMIEKSKTAHSQPIFLYAHILAPHAPFVIDATGKEVTFANQKTVQSEAYLAQVEGLNIKVYDAVSQVRESLPNAIVIIQGDHGSRLFKKEIGEIESHTVFSATYLPQKPLDKFTPNSNSIFDALFQSLNSK
ncbi:MAG: sulfatase-like hydrolase/transferase [Cyclobacteriaceae bacterium]